MAASKTGDIQHHLLVASVPGLGYHIQDITPENRADGHVFLQLGKRAGEGRFFTMKDFDSEANAKTYLDDCYALKGTIITAYDVHERAYENLAVQEIVPAGTDANGQSSAVVRVGNAVGGVTSGQYVVELIWIVRRTSS